MALLVFQVESDNRTEITMNYALVFKCQWFTTNIGLKPNLITSAYQRDLFPSLIQWQCLAFQAFQTNGDTTGYAISTQG